MTSPVKRFFGAILIAVGGLIAFLSGACTLVFIVLGMSASSAVYNMGMALTIGIVPFIVGVVLFILGRALWRG